MEIASRAFCACFHAWFWRRVSFVRCASRVTSTACAFTLLAVLWRRLGRGYLVLCLASPAGKPGGIYRTFAVCRHTRYLVCPISFSFQSHVPCPRSWTCIYERVAVHVELSSQPGSTPIYLCSHVITNPTLCENIHACTTYIVRQTSPVLLHTLYNQHSLP